MIQIHLAKDVGLKSMGLFDRIKAVKNAITGGAATINLEASPIQYDEPFNIKVTATVGDADLKIEKVYLQIIALEEVRVPDYDFEHDIDGNTIRKRETVKASVRTLNLDLTLDHAQTLEANQSYEWDTTIELPQNITPIYRGHFCQHTFKAFAGLDCFGNDPDSGWIELHD